MASESKVKINECLNVEGPILRTTLIYQIKIKNTTMGGGQHLERSIFWNLEISNINPSLVAPPNVDGHVLRAAPPVYSRTRRCQIMRVTGGLYVIREP